MEIRKVRVWWRKFDEDGNEIEKGFDEREYVNYGAAINRACKLFNSDRHIWSVGWVHKDENTQQPVLEWRIAERDPFVDYWGNYRCDICGAMHKRKENIHGGDIGDNLYVNLMNNEHNKRHRHKNRMCPDCAEKIHKFLFELSVGGVEQ